MPRINWKRAIGMLACLALLCGMMAVVPAGGTAEAQEAKPFTILHTNDEHSDLIPFGPAIDFPDYPTIGGVSRVAHEMNRIKAEKTAAGEPVLTLSGGDFSQGTLFGWLEKLADGHAELSLQDAMGYDAVAFGNHEFDMGAGYRAQVLNRAKADGVKLPILCANIYFDDTEPEAAALHALYSATDLEGAQLAIQPYTIKTLSNGLKVGIFGMLGENAEVDAPAATRTGVTFGNKEADPLGHRAGVAQDMVDTLRAAGCDVVVLLSHCGTAEEEALAAAVTGIDVIVGGHSHDLNYPPFVVNGTIIVQAGDSNRYLGDLELEYAGGKVSVRHATAIYMDGSIPTDPAVDAELAAYKTRLDGRVSTAMGQPVDIMAPFAETDIAGDGGFDINDSPPLVETNLGDIITDAYIQASNAANPTKPTRIAVEANGVIRSGIPKGGTGQFSFYDIHRSFPLGGDLSGAQMNPLGYPMANFYLTGAELKLALEAILAMQNNTYFLQLGGARISYDPAAPAFGKISSFELDDLAGGWEPLDTAALYRVATCQYVTYFMNSFGLAPRDDTGAVMSSLDDCILYEGPDQVRCWRALARMVAAMPDLDGDGIPNIALDYRYPQQRINAAGWYLAEGSTAGGMQTYVLVQNPTGEDVRVNLAFQTDSGRVVPDDLQGVEVPAMSRRTFPLDMWTNTFDVSTVVVEPVNGEIVCERAMYGGGGAWATDSIGATAPSGTWYLAEGSTAGGMQTYVLVQNPNGEDARVDLTFNTGADKISPDELQGVTVPAGTRQTFLVNNWVNDTFDVSTVVEATEGQVVVERAMYGGGGAWATDSIAATAPAAFWYLAEGSTAGGMQTYVLVQNPTAEDAKVNLVFNTGGGENAPAELQDVTIPAGTRRTFLVNDWVTTYDVSTTVVAMQGQVVVERAMYGGGGAWAHDSMGHARAAAL